MVVKEMPSGKKQKKHKLARDDSDCIETPSVEIPHDTPVNDNASTPHSASLKKSKKNKKSHASSGDNITEPDPVPHSPEKKTGKKRKREQIDASAEGSLEQSAPIDASENVKPKKKRKKERSEDVGNEPVSDEANDTVEGQTSPVPSEKKKPRSKKGENPVKPKDPKLEKRTVFVGNLPAKTNRRDLNRFFAKYGKVESVRLRSAPRLDAQKPIRMAVITHRFSEDRSSINAYVRFTTEAGAEKAAAEANGQLYEEHHLRVNMAMSESRPDPQLAVFVGGLPLNAEDNQLWSHFADCGTIVSVRIVRDRETSVGKGFGYVNFSAEEAVPRALKLNGSQLEGQTIRVQRCHATARPKVDRITGKKLRKARPEGEKPAPKAQDNMLAPVNKFSGDATAESKSSLKKKKGMKKKERRPDGRSQKRSLAQSLSKTIAPMPKAVSVPSISVGGVTPQNKKIKFDFGDDDGAPDAKKTDSEKLKEIKMKKEAKRKKKAKESEAKKKKNIVEPLTNILPS
ncbi:RNA-binding protein 34-like [Amphibalanus amphitrite]|uniref:RNA-binding protein 34-like n=1 Tax=Amphibalanus amphitrite TaxID=1232801 RepID=UPI001C920585|nr:RNA-binding protein 34-like [Amphibalanus amphitrite]XP_043196296.1 RNA-binding protein 34-like [Amphibalanus amphitrite]